MDCDGSSLSVDRESTEHHLVSEMRSVMVSRSVAPDTNVGLAVCQPTPSPSLRQGTPTVHVRVDQTGKHRPAARVDNFVAFLGGRGGRVLGDQAVSEPDRSPVSR